VTPAQIIGLILEGAVKAGLAIYQQAGMTEEQAKAALASDLLAHADAGLEDVAAVKEALARSKAALAELVKGE
jgi:hypothetical protein